MITLTTNDQRANEPDGESPKTHVRLDFVIDLTPNRGRCGTVTGAGADAKHIIVGWSNGTTDGISLKRVTAYERASTERGYVRSDSLGELYDYACHLWRIDVCKAIDLLVANRPRNAPSDRQQPTI